MTDVVKNMGFVDFHARQENLPVHNGRVRSLEINYRGDVYGSVIQLIKHIDANRLIRPTIDSGGEIEEHTVVLRPRPEQLAQNVSLGGRENLCGGLPILWIINKSFNLPIHQASSLDHIIRQQSLIGCRICEFHLH